MARKEYPSDHRRYFRVMEDILDDPKLAECTAAECWLFICLLACLNRMKSRDGNVTIPVRSVCAISRGRDWSGTRFRLESLQKAALLRYERAGKCLHLSIPNWPKIQGFATAELRRDSVQTPPPTPTPTPKKKEKSAAVAAGVISQPILNQVSEAFRAYGKPIRIWSDVRRKAMRARVREAGGDPSVLVSAVHGYAYYHRKSGANGFDPTSHLTPETIFRPSNFPKYLDAMRDAEQAGKKPPFRLGPESDSERYARIAREMEAEKRAESG